MTFWSLIPLCGPLSQAKSPEMTIAEEKDNGRRLTVGLGAMLVTVNRQFAGF